MNIPDWIRIDPENPPTGRLVLLSVATWPILPLPVKVGGYWDNGWHVYGASWTPTHYTELPIGPIPEGPILKDRTNSFAGSC